MTDHTTPDPEAVAAGLTAAAAAAVAQVGAAARATFDRTPAERQATLLELLAAHLRRNPDLCPVNIAPHMDGAASVHPYGPARAARAWFETFAITHVTVVSPRFDGHRFVEAAVTVAPWDRMIITAISDLPVTAAADGDRVALDTAYAPSTTAYADPDA